MTMMLARGKLEQLRGLAWAVDAAGAPIADATADIAVVPEQPHGGTGVSPSPAGTLGRNTPGYCDFLDASGRPVAPGLDASEPPGGAVYIRRWAVTPLDTSPADTLVLQVLVTTRRDRGAADVTTRVERLPDEARIVAVKTRKRG
jgi:hypothetical protein